MTHSTDHRILQYVEDHPDCPVRDVLQQFGLDNHRVTQESIFALTDQKLLYFHSRSSEPLGALSITHDGRALLEQLRISEAEAAKKKAEEERREATRLQERAEDAAREERSRTLQNKFAIKLALMSFFLGMITEHFVQIVSFCIGLFH